MDLYVWLIWPHAASLASWTIGVAVHLHLNLRCLGSQRSFVLLRMFGARIEIHRERAEDIARGQYVMLK